MSLFFLCQHPYRLRKRIVLRVAYINHKEDYGRLTIAVPSRPGSKHSELRVQRQPYLLTEPERGGPVLFRDEYERVKAQYLAIENLDARQKFLYEREQLLDGIDLVGPVFLFETNFCSRSYALAC